MDYSPPPKLWTPSRPAIIRASALPRSYAEAKKIALKHGSFPMPTFVPAVAAAAFPTVVSSNSNTTASSTTHTLNLPASLVSGNLILIFFGAAANRSLSSGPSGFTQLYFSAAGSDSNIGCWYKVSDGTEGSSTSLTLGLASAGAATTYQISGYSGNPQSATVNTNGLDPNSLTPSGGSKKYLWIAHGVASTNISALPTNYGNALGSGNICATGRRELEASSEDPGAFSGTGNTKAGLVAISPA